MQINEDFWGGADKAETLMSDIETNNYYTLTALQNGDIPLNVPLDVTVSPWAININADFVKLKYGLSYRVGDSGYVWASPEYYDIHDFESDREGIPFYFCFPQYTNNGGTSLNWQRRNGVGLSTSDLAEPSTKTTFAMSNKIVRKLSYDKLAYYARVRYAEHEYVPGMSMNDFGYMSTATLGDYFNHTDSWLEDHSIVQIYLTPYYIGVDTDYPNYFATLDLWMNSLGYKQECPLVGTDYVEHGYTTAYIDDFMTLIGDGSHFIGEYGYDYGGNGWIRINRSDNYWVQSYNEDVDCQMSVEYNENPILKVPSYDGTKWVIRTKWEGGPVYIRTELNRSAFDTAADFEDYVRTQIAYVGTWWFEDTAATSETPGSSDKWFLGEINDNGITTGHYEQGQATSTLPNSTWTDPWEDSGWSGRSEDPTQWDENQISHISTATGDPSYGTSEYLMTQNALDQLIRVLNEFKVAEAEGEFREGWCEKVFGSSDPLDVIVSVIKYPFDMTHDWACDSSRIVVSGSNVGQYFSVGATVIPVSVQSSIPVVPTPYTIDLTSAHEIYQINWDTTHTQWAYGVNGKCKIPYFDKYGDFLSYEPYCTAELYAPFCGSVRIDPQIYVGKDVRVEYIVSPIDGTTKALIKRDNLVIDTLTGNIGTSIEIHTTDDVAKANNINLLNATIQSQKMNMAKSVASFATSGLMAIATGGTSGALSLASTALSIPNMMLNNAQTNNAIQQLQYRIDTAETPFKQLQTGGGYLSSADEYAIRLVAYRPTTLIGYSFTNWGNYGHTTGFACHETKTLNNLHGYTECSNAVLDGIDATDSEKQMILQLLQSGVYLP